MKTELIQAKDYLLFIDEEAEIKGSPFLCYNPLKITWDDDIVLYQGVMPEYNYKGLQKIIAYYPLTKEAKELDLSLLPNPFEEVDVKKLAERYFIQCEPTIYARHKKLFDAQSDKKRDYIGDRDYIIQTYIKGYKAAQQSNKQFSLEDIEQILFDYDNVDWTKREHKQSTIMMKEWLKDKIQSLSTQQLPKEFIPETYCNYGDDCPSKGAYDKQHLCDIRIKTITNPKGKQELVGKYIS